jgi:thiol:disulfide interchange protein/DsbC/DsbD-like thiol-disulfide interchange protein
MIKHIYSLVTYFAICLGLFVTPITAQESGNHTSGNYAEITLTPQYLQSQAGDSINLLLTLDLRENWHSYWENPGDSGYPVTLEIRAQENAKIIGQTSQIPEIIAFDNLVNYGYHDKFYINYNLELNKDLRKGGHKINLELAYLVCKDICIPEFMDLDFEITIAEDKVVNAEYSELLAQSQKSFPRDTITNARFNIEDDFVVLAIDKASIPSLTQLYFFPKTHSFLKYELEQVSQVIDQIYFKFPYDNDREVDQLVGVLQTSGGGIDIQAEYDQDLLYPADLSLDIVYLAKLILYAIIGGIILNFMPCVFPVLSLKCLHIANSKNKKLSEIKRSAFFYLLGIEVSFVIFAVLIILLKKAGFAIGWGFHMQSAYFVGFLIMLFYLIALNLSDIFTLNNFYLSNANYKSSSESVNSFLSGALMTIVATPCTGPFMAAAIGFAFTQANAVIYLIFLALGFGLALPVILISLSEVFIRFIPRSGKWLISFKQFLAFPFYLTVVWLLWIFNNLTNTDLLFLFIITLLVITFTIWMIGKLHNPLFKIALVILTVLAPYCFYNHVSMSAGSSPSSQYLYTADYSEKLVQKLVLKNKKIFINVTADWCITCQYNKVRSFGTSEVIEFFNRNEIHYIEADWTHYNAEITDLLAKYDRSGIPLYLYIDQGETMVLPQLLSREDIFQMVKR